MKATYEKLLAPAATREEAFRRLVDIVEILRKECPWDKEQTHETLTRCMIEEAYEAVEAVNNRDVANLREELGDVMLQVVFHASLSNEAGEFTFADVLNEECEKMIRRHPHIFSDERAKTVDKVLEKWENIKRKEHGNSNYTQRLKDVPHALPALIRSEKVLKRAAEGGVDWNTPEEILKLAAVRFEAFCEAVALQDTEKQTRLWGDFLFCASAASRKLGMDSEDALNQATARFIEEFARREEPTEEQGTRLRDWAMSGMDTL